MLILNWLNREQSLKEAGRAPYRLLETDAALSYGDPDTENMLIQGDNLEALKVLLPYYAGEVKFIFIDPLYNTKSAFGHSDDNLEHTQWWIGCSATPRYPHCSMSASPKRTIYRLAASGEIPAFKIGGTWRFSRSDIERWIKQQSAGSPERSANRVSNE